MSTLKVDTITDTTGAKNPTLVNGTVQATTSGTAFDFTGIPSWVTRISVLLWDVSLSGTDNILIQLGDSGGFETTGYESSGSRLVGGNNFEETSTAGFLCSAPAGSNDRHVVFELYNITGNSWVCSHAGSLSGSSTIVGGGIKSLTGTLTQVRLTRTGTDTFDSGQVNIQYE